MEAKKLREAKLATDTQMEAKKLREAEVWQATKLWLEQCERETLRQQTQWTWILHKPPLSHPSEDPFAEVWPVDHEE